MWCAITNVVSLSLSLSDCVHYPGVAIGVNMIDCMLHLINVTHYGFSAICNLGLRNVVNLSGY